MPYYHVYVEYTNKKGEIKDLFHFDWSKESLIKYVVNPIKKSKNSSLLGESFTHLP